MSGKTFSLSGRQKTEGAPSIFCLTGLTHSSSHAADEALWLRGKRSWQTHDRVQMISIRCYATKTCFLLSRQVILRIKAANVLQFGRFTIFIVTTALAVINAKWRCGSCAWKGKPLIRGSGHIWGNSGRRLCAISQKNRGSNISKCNFAVVREYFL